MFLLSSLKACHLAVEKGTANTKLFSKEIGTLVSEWRPVKSAQLNTYLICILMYQLILHGTIAVVIIMTIFSVVNFHESK